MISEAFDPNPRAAPGGNNPPAPTPYEAVKTHCDDLYEEAKHWLDGSVVETQEQADAVGRLLGMLREATHAADEARKAEAEPHDTAKAEIQARYNKLIGTTKAVTGTMIRAQDACKAALAPFLRKKEEEQRAAAEAARREAEERARIAAEAARAADAANLAEVEQAESLVKTAGQALKGAKKAESARANAGGGETRAVGLRSVWTPALVDAGAALTHYAERRPDELKTLLLKLAQDDVRAGARSIPGFAITETKVPV
jgi:hypothetical protein